MASGETAAADVQWTAWGGARGGARGVRREAGAGRLEAARRWKSRGVMKVLTAAALPASPIMAGAFAAALAARRRDVEGPSVARWRPASIPLTQALTPVATSQLGWSVLETFADPGFSD